MTLAEYRDQLAWSQAELARKAGISAPTVSKAERGDAINGKSANRICNALSQALGRTISVRDVKGWKVEV